MARGGAKRPRPHDHEEPDPLLCPYEGCQYRGKSLHALGVHTGMAKHIGPLRVGVQESEISDELSNPDPESFSSEASGSRSACSGAASVISDDSLNDYQAGDIQPVQEHVAVQPQFSSQSSEDGHAPSEGPSAAEGMNIPLGNANGLQAPDQISEGSARNQSASSNQVHENPTHDAALASNNTLTEADKRLHGVLVGLPLQRQQQIIDMLRDPAVDLSSITAASARRLRKDVKALSKQVRVP